MMSSENCSLTVQSVLCVCVFISDEAFSFDFSVMWNKQGIISRKEKE